MIRTLGLSDEMRLRRWLFRHGDADFAVHRQLRDYFLAPTTAFGTAVVDSGSDDWPAGIFFSRHGERGYIHQFAGDSSHLNDLLEWLGVPVQAFFQEGVDLDPSVWGAPILSVTPGFVVDHPAYDGVFSRTAPRFRGAVYETKGFR